MDNHALFTILPFSSYEEALQELLNEGMYHAYEVLEHDSSLRQIGGFFNHLPKGPLKHSVRLETSTTIDWDHQWALHSPYYKENCLKVDLRDFGASLEDPYIYLKPGPGFGDLSHISTQLILQVMTSYVPKTHVIDIGCGSGILSLAAQKLEALSVQAIDIDSLAINHAKQNASLNGFSDIRFGKVLKKNSVPSTILINMILEEQVSVFSSFPFLKGTFILSGLLKGQKDLLLNKTKHMGFKFISDLSKDGWELIILNNC